MKREVKGKMVESKEGGTGWKRERVK